jgi:hypothetical protein
VSPGEIADLDLNSVAESGQSGFDQPAGAPIIHSTKEGFRRSAVLSLPSFDGRLEIAPLDRDSVTLSSVFTRPSS